MSERRLRLLLLAGASLVSGVVVATAFHPAPHPGGDNAGYLSLAYGLLSGGAYVDAWDPARLPHVKYPPVFPLVLAALMALGARTWVVFKGVAAVSTVASVALAYLWAERRLGHAAGFAVALLLALSTAVVYYSHWILSDPLFVALTLGALVALDRAEPEAPIGWLALGVVAAGLALFTRSAGLPLVVAMLSWLALSRRGRALGVVGVALGVPAALWWWRGRSGGVGAYATELWMVDPYQPALGTIGVLDLIPRALANLQAYVLTHGPGGVVGQDAAALGAFGVALTLAAIAGWVVRFRDGPGPAELFFPLYAGLILVWPEVWAGDRFALPLYPLVFVYGALALRRLGEHLPRVVVRVGAPALLVALLLPAGARWIDAAREAAVCNRAAREAGPFACWGPRVGAFVTAAEWSGRSLPEGAVVLSRKPRHWFVLSGVPSRTFPFDEDPAAHLALADSLGARYVLLDQWDGLAGRYVGSAVRARPGAFCFVQTFGDPARGAAQLLGIRARAAREGGAPDGATAPRIVACPPEYLRAGAGEGYSSPPSAAIPLLVALDS